MAPSLRPCQAAPATACAALFSRGYKAGIALRGFGAEMFAGAATPTTAVLAPGATAPLSVSWSGRAVAVEVEGSRLALH
jgi:hypothetical protein